VQDARKPPSIPIHTFPISVMTVTRKCILIVMMKMNELTKLGIKFGTDKAYWHRYTDFYSKFFKEKKELPNVILEIGISTGASIKMLHKYFNRSIIYCMDIKEECVENAKQISKRVKPFLCDQGNKTQMTTSIMNLNTSFDIIIDDGSHHPAHQKLTLETLFPFLNPGGIYICEDIHTSIEAPANESMIRYLEGIQYSFGRANRINHRDILNVKFFHRDKPALRCFQCGKDNHKLESECSCGIDLSPSPDDSITSVIIKKQ